MKSILSEVPKKQYVITGHRRNGQRFKAILTETPWHYNIWIGSIWSIEENGKRKLVKRIYN